MGYGPVVQNGYGASYNPQANRIIFCFSSFKSFSETDSQTFGEELNNVLLVMRDLCLSGKPKASPRNNNNSLQTIKENAQKMNGEQKDRKTGT